METALADVTEASGHVMDVLRRVDTSKLAPLLETLRSKDDEILVSLDMVKRGEGDLGEALGTLEKAVCDSMCAAARQREKIGAELQRQVETKLGEVKAEVVETVEQFGSRATQGAAEQARKLAELKDRSAELLSAIKCDLATKIQQEFDRIIQHVAELDAASQRQLDAKLRKSTIGLTVLLVIGFLAVGAIAAM